MCAARRAFRLAALGLLIAAGAACGSGRSGTEPDAARVPVPVGTARAGGGFAAPGAALRSRSEERAARPNVIGTWRPQPSSPDVPAVPVAIEIRSIGVLAPVVPLGLTPTRELAVPESEDVVGWWTGGSPPGRPGPSVLVGHVDSDRRPGVFERLRDLDPGDEVSVLRDDGTAVSYVVERVEQRPKAAFPTREVYGPTSGPTLRLITCGGSFDKTSRHYLDNVIVYARAPG